MLQPLNEPPSKTVLITEKNLATLIQKVGMDQFMDLLIQDIEDGFRLYESGRIEILPRYGFTYEMPKYGLLELMPARLKGDGVYIKTVGYHSNNVEVYSLPTILAKMDYFSQKNGLLMATGEATLLTALRTGAATAVATRYLARRDSRAVGIIGTGTQALTQLHALSRVMDLKQVFAYDQVEERAKKFRERVKDHLPLLPLPKLCSIEELCAVVDVLVTATTIKPGDPPVVLARWIRPGTHLNAVGSDVKGKAELEDKLVKKAKVIADYLPQALGEGECQVLSEQEVYTELGKIVTGKKVGRELTTEITIFDSTGFAIEDLMAFKRVLELAQQYDLEKETEFAGTSFVDPQDPYHFLKCNPKLF